MHVANVDHAKGMPRHIVMMRLHPGRALIAANMKRASKVLADLHVHHAKPLARAPCLPQLSKSGYLA